MKQQLSIVINGLADSYYNECGLCPPLMFATQTLHLCVAQASYKVLRVA